MIDRELQKYFNFDEADLFSNRSGILTTRQRKRLEGSAQFSRKVFLAAGIAILFVAVFPSVILYFSKTARLFLVIWSAVWIPVWAFIGIKVMGIGRPDPKGFQLKSVEGDANIVREEHYHQSSERREVDYELHIGGVTFDVDSGLADIIMQGDTCAVYYIEGTKEIVSAEILEPARKNSES